MLYDVLPPLVFFTSLGGIILVVFRVVLRVRKQQFEDSVQVAMSRASAGHSTNAEDLAEIIGPSSRSVQVIRNRVTLTAHGIRGSLTSVSSSIHGMNKRRQAWLEQRKLRDKEVGARQSFTAKIKELGRSGRRALAERAALLSKKVAQRSVSGEATAPRQQPPRLSIREVGPDEKKETLVQSAKAQKGRMFSKRKRQKPALLRARQALNDADHEKAENILVPYLAKHPKETDAYMMLGEVAMLRRNWDEAMEIFEQVIHVNPRVRGSFAALGRAAYEAGKFTRAIEALQRAHDADPRDAEVLRRLLKIAQRMDNVPMQKSLSEELLAIKAAEQQSEQHPKVPAR
jgi:tetratricopeptide (TPR) repeat protein